MKKSTCGILSALLVAMMAVSGCGGGVTKNSKDPSSTRTNPKPGTGGVNSGDNVGGDSGAGKPVAFKFDIRTVIPSDDQGDRALFSCSAVLLNNDYNEITLSGKETDGWVVDAKWKADSPAAKDANDDPVGSCTLKLPAGFNYKVTGADASGTTVGYVVVSNPGSAPDMITTLSSYVTDKFVLPMAKTGRLSEDNVGAYSAALNAAAYADNACLDTIEDSTESTLAEVEISDVLRASTTLSGSKKSACRASTTGNLKYKLSSVTAVDDAAAFSTIVDADVVVDDSGFDCQVDAIGGTAISSLVYTIESQVTTAVDEDDGDNIDADVGCKNLSLLDDTLVGIFGLGLVHTTTFTPAWGFIRVPNNAADGDDANFDVLPNGGYHVLVHDTAPYDSDNGDLDMSASNTSIVITHSAAATNTVAADNHDGALNETWDVDEDTAWVCKSSDDSADQDNESTVYCFSKCGANDDVAFASTDGSAQVSLTLDDAVEVVVDEGDTKETFMYMAHFLVDPAQTTDYAQQVSIANEKNALNSVSNMFRIPAEALDDGSANIRPLDVAIALAQSHAYCPGSEHKFENPANDQQTLGGTSAEPVASFLGFRPNASVSVTVGDAGTQTLKSDQYGGISHSALGVVSGTVITAVDGADSRTCTVE